LGSARGDHPFEGTPAPGSIPPIHEYAHGVGSCAVTGGYVYRGERIPDLAGAYVFGDFCRSVLEAFVPLDGRATQARPLGRGSMTRLVRTGCAGRALCAVLDGNGLPDRDLTRCAGIAGVDAGFWMTPADRRARWRRRIDERTA
jgi:hypothetical protein